MCLLRSLKTEFFARAKADLLSTLSSTASVSLPRRSPSSRASQIACIVAESSGDVLCLTAGQSHHLLLDRLPADKTLAEEKHRPARTLARVDVAGVVVVTVTDEVCRVRIPRVVQVIVEGARDVADDPLDGLQMLCRRSLHEPTDVGSPQDAKSDRVWVR